MTGKEANANDAAPRAMQLEQKRLARHEGSKCVWTGLPEIDLIDAFEFAQLTEPFPVRDADIRHWWPVAAGHLSLARLAEPLVALSQKVDVRS